MAAFRALGGRFRQDDIAVGAESLVAEALDQFRFKGRGDSMLEVFGLVVDLVPFHAKNFGEHTFDEVVTQGSMGCGFAALGSEAHDAVGLYLDISVAFEALDRHRHGRGRDRKPMREQRRNHGLPSLSLSRIALR